MAKKKETPTLGDDGLKQVIEAEQRRNSKFIESLGGLETVYDRIELSKVILTTYRKRGETVEEIVGSVLEEFRNNVKEQGFTGITKEMIPVVSHYGTIEDRTALVLNAYFDKKNYDGEPLLSLEQINEIKAAIGKMGLASKTEFMRYLSRYDTLIKAIDLLLRLKYAFTSVAYHVIIYIQIYEWLGKTEELYNSFAPLVAEDKKEKFKKIAENYNSYLQSYQIYGELKEITGDKWVDRQRKACFDYAETATEFVVKRLEELKGGIKGIKLWIIENKAELLVPLHLKELVVDIERGYIQELQSKYYKSHLKHMEKRGETITDYDRKIAIFPEYEEVEPDKDAIHYIKKKLDGYTKKY